MTVDTYDPAGGFWPESRVFSIASPPGADIITIIYSVKGIYTRKMESKLKPGANVWLKLPYGEFIIDNNIREGQDLVLVAGGTGISPYIPYLEDALVADSTDRGVRLYYGARQNRMLIAKELIGRCIDAGVLEAHLFIENEAPDDSYPSGANIGRGRLDIDTIFAESAGLRDPVFFLSGPPVMIKAFKVRLGELGIDAERIKIDEWE